VASNVLTNNWTSSILIIARLIILLIFIKLYIRFIYFILIIFSINFIAFNHSRIMMIVL
jgi:hypothetical protein